MSSSPQAAPAPPGAPTCAPPPPAVEAPETAASPSSSHPEDACRYLVHLANLRGGQDNITVVVLRIGPWIEPGSGESATAPEEAPKAPRAGRGFPPSRPLPGRGRKPEPEPVEEHVYTT